MHPSSMTSPRRSSAAPPRYPGPEDWDEEYDYEEDDEPKRSKKKRKSKKGKKNRHGPLWATSLVFIGAILIILSGGVMITTKVLLDKATASINTVDIGNSDSTVASGKALEGALNILLVGVDEGQVAGVDSRSISKERVRADSIMILHVPPSHDRGYIVSIPRDTYVSIPKYAKTNKGGYRDKINAAFDQGYGEPEKGGPGRAGGLELLMMTIFRETGITFNAAAIVNFNGFTEAVKQLGGVNMYIDEKVTSVHYGFTGLNETGNHCVPAVFDEQAKAHPVGKTCHPRVFEVGTRHLTAEEALDYTRQREWMELEDGDYGRQRHQQQFIKALVREAKSQGLTTNLPKALNLVNSVGSALTMWTNGASVQDWFLTLKDIAGSEIVMIKTNRGTYSPAGLTNMSAELLSDDSRAMFQALRAEKIDSWLVAHPEWLGTDASG